MPSRGSYPSHLRPTTDWLTVEEARERAGVKSSDTIRNWTRRGLPYRLIDGQIRIQVGELDTFKRPEVGRPPTALDFDSLSGRSLELFYFELQLLHREHARRLAAFISSWRPTLDQELDALQSWASKDPEEMPFPKFAALPVFASTLNVLIPWQRTGPDHADHISQPPPLRGDPPDAATLRRLREVHRWVLVSMPFARIAKRVNETDDTARRLEKRWQQLYGPTPADLGDRLTEWKETIMARSISPEATARAEDLRARMADPKLETELTSFIQRGDTL